MKILSKIKNFFSKDDSTKSFYSLIGEHSGLVSIVSDFYYTMENDPKAARCLKVHELDNGKVSQQSRERLVMFLSGWLGGPNLFVENVGAPKMRMRHAQVKISEAERVEWLYCMEQALGKVKISRKNKRSFLRSLEALSLRIKNS